MQNTMRRTSQVLRLICLSATLLGSSVACATAGTKFDPAVVEQLTPGMTLNEVKKQLGRPNHEVFSNDGRKLEIWSYSHANGFTGKGDSRSVALVFDAKDSYVRMLSKGESSTKF